MTAYIRIYILIFFITSACAQTTIEKTLHSYNKGTVPYITADSLASLHASIILDSRAKKEFEVSHLQDAIWVGYKHFNLDSIQQQIPDRNSEIIVYCSVGVRSEDIGEKLIEAGYTRVFNLYGGIFHWKNSGYPVYNIEGNKTDSVHAYSKHWGKLLTNAEKVY